MNTIIIPSKYIYDIKNEKVKNNVIKNVSFDLHNARYENENNNYTEVSRNLLSAYLSGGSPTFKAESDLDGATTLTYEKDEEGGYYRKAQLIKVPFSIKPKISFNGVSSSSVYNIILNNLKFSISWSDVIHAKINGTWEEEINVVDKTYKWLSTGNNFTAPKFNGTGVSVKYEALLVNNGNNDTEDLANWGFPYIGRVLFMVMSASNSSIDGYVYVPYQVESKVSKNGELLRVSTIENFVISLSGNISTLVISDTNEVIGNSNEVDISIGGNELFQTQNKYASRDYVDELYQEITTNWENGKETATITCSISDYFAEEKSSYVIKEAPTEYEGTIGFTIWTSVNVKGILDDYFANDKNVIYVNGEKGIITDYDTEPVNGYEKKYYYITLPSTAQKDKLQVGNSVNIKILAISKTDVDLPMTFNIGDIVCPMVLRNNGEKWIDEPMSFRNKEQKNFVVEGIEIYYDGATMQRIYLIEND
jgi:hypothetical protein